jgi:hypothetical protein
MQTDIQDLITAEGGRAEKKMHLKPINQPIKGPGDLRCHPYMQQSLHVGVMPTENAKASSLNRLKIQPGCSRICWNRGGRQHLGNLSSCRSA